MRIYVLAGHPIPNYRASISKAYLHTAEIIVRAPRMNFNCTLAGVLAKLMAPASPQYIVWQNIFMRRTKSDSNNI